MTNNNEGKEIFKRIAFGYKHENILEAVAADLLDIVPFAGDLSNSIRVRNARKEGDTPEFRLQLIDGLVGIFPFIGDILDAATPTNTINFVNRKAKLEMPEPIKRLTELVKAADDYVGSA